MTAGVSSNGTAARAGGLTAAEQLIWAGQRLAPDSPLYNMALAVEVAGPVSLEALRESFRDLVRDDEVLRTVYHERDGVPLREILPHLEAQVELLDLAEEVVDEASVLRTLEERTQRGLPLTERLFDACLVRRRSDRHIIFLNQHHLTTDAWSAGLLFKRWGAFYREIINREDYRTDHPRYTAYVERELALRSTSQLGRALDYWGRTRPASSPRLTLYGNAAAGSGRTMRIRVPFGSRRAAELRELTQQQPFRALTAEQSRYLVFATLLIAWINRVSDERSVSLGSPWHNRGSADLRETLGLFMELYPLRVSVADGETLASLGSKVAAAAAQMMRHVVPGASAAAGARGFFAVLNYITARMGDFAGMPTKTNWIHPGFGDPEHKIRLQVHDFDAQGEPTLDFDLDVEVFDTQARQWVIDHFLRLFDALVANPTQRLATVPMVRWEEEIALTPRGPILQSPNSVIAAFRAQAAGSPGAIAVFDGAAEITYRDLQRRVQLLATELVSRGVRRGVVGVLLERSTDLLVAILAILEAGAAYVPLDPGHPDARLGFVAEDAGVKLVLTSPDLLARARRLSGSEGAISMTELEARSGESAPIANYGALPLPDKGDLAYVLYTSGSTGKPKGVEVTHGALADYVDWARRTYAAEGPLRFALFTSPAFDFTVTSIFTPLVSGGSVVVYREEQGNSGLLVRRVFEDDMVDVVKLTPSHLALLRDMDLRHSRVRRLIVGGEDFKTSVARRAHEALGGRREVFNEYGPTEATVACMIHRFDPQSDVAGSVPIGRPADNMRVHVLDVVGQPVPRGSKGEIYIAGPRLARGYRGRPGTMAAAFVDYPADAGATMYKTGDLGRWNASWQLEFLGRLDEQVKIRGVRLELGEVEAALTRHPAIRDAVATLLRGAPPPQGHCRICGLEAAHPEADLDEHGTCAVCRSFSDKREQIARYFGSLDELSVILANAKENATEAHDTLMLYSGGKDSTYALCRIVEMGAHPLVFFFDNGFISDDAKRNIRRVVDQLGLELVVGQAPAMPEVFAESLQRFSNVCNGCFKVIYTLAMNLAVQRGIGTIVTGLSRGQIFETRLADLYRRGIHDPVDVDRMILQARKAYHRMEDAVSRSLDTRVFQSDQALDAIRFVDFYRYCDASLEEVMRYVAEHTPWVRPTDTGRSTNCLINQAGIFVHKTERGFHNYTMPYSWDVRLGHKSREAALKELDDDLDPAVVRRMLDRVGYREREPDQDESRLVAYYSADSEVSVSELRRFLAESLPAEVIPSAFVRLDKMPLTPNGKIDRNDLPRPPEVRPLLDGVFVEPGSPEEAMLAEIWSDVLGLRRICIHDDFFELGGDSMHCIQIVAAAANRGLDLAPRDLFAHPTIASLARIASHGRMRPAPQDASATPAELAELARELGG